MTGVADGRVDELLAEPLMQQYSPDPGPFSRGVVACTGSEFCRFAIVETKEQRRAAGPRSSTRRYAAALERSDAADADEVIRIHFSGCSASCAQPQIADIGLRGDTAHVGERDRRGGRRRPRRQSRRRRRVRPTGSIGVDARSTDVSDVLDPAWTRGYRRASVDA